MKFDALSELDIFCKSYKDTGVTNNSSSVVLFFILKPKTFSSTFLHDSFSFDFSHAACGGGVKSPIRRCGDRRCRSW